METRPIEGTYTENAEETNWTGHYYECNECGQAFMLNLDSNKCFCPGCGKFLIWKDAVNGVE